MIVPRYCAGQRGLCAALLLALTSLIADAHATTGACGMPLPPASKMLVHLPFKTVDGRIYVQAEVNGRGPYTFAVDTGASGMARADASLATALQLPISHKTESSDGVQTSSVDTVHFKSLRIGELQRTDFDAITRDYSSRAAPEARFFGILGREFFADGLLVIDYPTQTLSFTRDAALQAGQPDTLSYRRAFRVPVSIGDIQAEGNLDTGANVSFVLPKALHERVEAGELQHASTGTLTNTRIETSRARLHGPVRVGQLELSDVEVRVSDRYPELLVGAHALQGYRLLSDQRSNNIAICKPQAAD